MATLRQNIPHVQQPINSAWCGAACLKMIYELYNIPCSLEEIWNEVKGIDERTHDVNCRLYLMGRHVRKMNLNPCVISTPNPIQTLDACFNAGLHVVTLFRSDLQSNLAHFVVVTGWDSDRIFFNDPWDDCSVGKDKSIPLVDWFLRGQPTATSQLTTANTMLLIGSALSDVLHLQGIHDPNIGIESVDVFPAVVQNGLKVLCLEHDRWF